MSFVWNGVSSDTMKFNVTSRQVYNAPAYDLNAIEVPGRSGDLLNPQNRFKNKQVTYTGFLKASDFEGSTWRKKLSTGLIQLKGWLCSDAGNYHELTDDYDPGFTRYGYISGETAISDIEDRPFGVTLTVTFNCKPFMYKAGEPMELPEVKTVGPAAIASFSDGAQDAPLKSLVFNIEPSQDLHGYSYPWPAGGGKNLMPNAIPKSETANGVTFTLDEFGVFKITGTASAHTSCDFPLFNSFVIPSSDPAPQIAYCNSVATTNVSFLLYNGNTRVDSWSLTPINRTANYLAMQGKTCDKYRIDVDAGTTVNMTLSPMILANGVTDYTFEPYSNICPISGWTQVNGKHSGADMTDYTPITIPLGRTVYGGTVDVIAGEGDSNMVLLDSAALKSKVVSFNAATNRLDIYDYTNLAPDGQGATVNSADAVSNMFACDLSWNQMGSGTHPWKIGVYKNASWNYTRIYIFFDTTITTRAQATTWLDNNNVQLCFRKATGTELSLTPQTIKTLLGVNNIWADSGDTTLEYPIPTESPYPFESRPLYEITMSGTGTLTVNGKEWTITNYTGTLYCDTEAMEWYDASQLRNNIVSGDGWPVFEAGENSVSYTGDITKVMVTPRWRTL